MSNDAPLPLDDIRVLDLTHYYHGPYATMLLGYLGAEVIKIEMPGVGDGMRPLYRRKDQPFGIPFALMNSNKRAITLNLKHERDRALPLEMAGCAYTRTAPESPRRRGGCRRGNQQLRVRP